MTADELFALPTDDRIDRRLLRGRLVERPYPFRDSEHATTVANLSRLLLNWQRLEGREWKVYGYGCPYRLTRSPDTLLYFDASVVAAGQTPDDKRAAFVDAVPTFAVEVVDSSDTAEAVKELLQTAVDAGVEVVWAVAPDLELVDEFSPKGEHRVLVCGDEVDLGHILPGLKFGIHELFE